MKVHVKSLSSRKYLADGGTWTTDASQARDFDDSSDAVLFCSLHGLEDAELVAESVHAPVGVYFSHAPVHHRHALDD